MKCIKIKMLLCLLFVCLTINSVDIYAQDSKLKVPEITAPPAKLKLDPFYTKYMDANGIPVTSSWRVPDEALIKAWEIVTFMTNGLPPKVLKTMIKNGARMAVMARYEGTTDLPEQKELANDTTINWDVRARGLGGMVGSPLSSCAEENLLCYQIDKYHAEDITIHEFSHGIHLLGIAPSDDTFNDRLTKLYNNAIAAGKYENTYAKTNIEEYWAEAVQDWFNVNAEVPTTDGKHNWVNTREDLKKYDPDLYELLSHYFEEFEVSPSCHAAGNLYKGE